MRNLHKTLGKLACLGLFVVGAAQGATITGQVNYLDTLGVSGWGVSFTSSDPQVQLQKMVIQLPATLMFDTQLGGFGFQLPADFNKVSGGATGAASNPTTQALRDGAAAVTIDFTGFTAGTSPFRFRLDVDGTPATPCAAGISGTACRNAASVVNAGEIAGTSILLTFGCPGCSAITYETVLASLNGPAGLAAQGSFYITPEPSTYALMGAGLAGLALLRRRRS